MLKKVRVLPPGWARPVGCVKNRLMMTNKVLLPKQYYKQICRHAERVYPEECCGLLLGESIGGTKSVHHIIETENEAEDTPHRRYCIPPKALFDAERLVREKGWEVLGVYHSHPDHPARPSDFDRERAILQYEYIILSVLGGRAAEMSCWSLRDPDPAFEREDLRVTPSAL